MINDSHDYGIFHDFINAYLPIGFEGINREDELMLKLEEVMEANNQFFLVMDITQLKILFTSKRSLQMIGADPVSVNPTVMLQTTHPDDTDRFCLARAKALNIDKDLYKAKTGSLLLSTDIRMRRPDNGYSNLLFQCYFFYSAVPVSTVFLLQLHTNIDSFPREKNSFHYYTGNDLSFFRYPDEELLAKGINFSKRELQIMKLIKEGLSNDAIAEKLFISIHTVTTHRSNIIDKSQKPSISYIIYDLVEQGLI